ARVGAEALPAESLSGFIPAPLAWRGDATGQTDAVAKELGLPDLGYGRPPRELAGDADSIVSARASLPPGYERPAGGGLAAGRFRRPCGHTAPGHVRVEYHTRIDGPDRYVVVDSDGQARTTLSRSWALLDGFRRARIRAFIAVGAKAIVRRGDDGPHVPLPVARAVALRSGVVAGPTEAAESGRDYAYWAEDAVEQRWLLSWLKGVRGDASVARRFAWLLAATAAGTNTTVTLPADLRRRLRELHEVPDALAMADRRIPRHLLPHVRRAADLAEA